MVRLIYGPHRVSSRAFLVNRTSVLSPRGRVLEVVKEVSITRAVQRGLVPCNVVSPYQNAQCVAKVRPQRGGTLATSTLRVRLFTTSGPIFGVGPTFLLYLGFGVVLRALMLQARNYNPPSLVFWPLFVCSQLLFSVPILPATWCSHNGQVSRCGKCQFCVMTHFCVSGRLVLVRQVAMVIAHLVVCYIGFRVFPLSFLYLFPLGVAVSLLAVRYSIFCGVS